MLMRYSTYIKNPINNETVMIISSDNITDIFRHMRLYPDVFQIYTVCFDGSIINWDEIKNKKMKWSIKNEL